MQFENLTVRRITGPRSPNGTGIPVYVDTGVTNLAPDHILGSAPNYQNPAVWHTYFNDFDTSADISGITDTSTWDITNVGAGTIALADGDHGVLLLTNAAADDNNLTMQKKGSSFKLEAGKPMMFSTRLKVNDATQSDFMAGLVVAGGGIAAATDGIFFVKDDGAALLDFKTVKVSVVTRAQAIYTVVSDTYLSLHWYYDGGSRITYGVNGVTLGSVAYSTGPDVALLTPTLAVQNGEAVVKTMSVDYVLASKMR